MDKKTIDQRDSSFVQKIADLRTDLIARKQAFHTGQKKTICSKLFPVLISSIFLLYLIHSFSTQKETPDLSLNGTQTATSEVNHSSDQALCPAQPEPERATAITETKIDEQPETPSLGKSANVCDPVIQETGSVITEGETTCRPKPTVKPPGDRLSIAASVVCTAVKNRIPVGEQYVFSIRETRKPVVWMDARSEKLPRTLKHIYFCNGQKYCEVPLLIKHPRMRTWSRVTLNSPAHIGKWRVDIATEDGVILEQLEFRVIP